MTRNLVAATAAACALLAPSAQGAVTAALGPGEAAQTHPPRLAARPGPGGGRCAPGTHTLGLGGGRTALMRVTPGDGRKALLVALHGAGGSAAEGLWSFRGAFGSRNVVIVAPDAESRVWNPFYGGDLRAIDRALAKAFSRCRIDPRRVAIGGFSDGAGNALTLGLSNGDLFRAVIALAPGGMQVEAPVGKPRVFLAHGTRDTVIPVRSSAELARTLRADGYTVTYRTFGGGHEVPDALSKAAARWFLER